MQLVTFVCGSEAGTGLSGRVRAGCGAAADHWCVAL